MSPPSESPHVDRAGDTEEVGDTCSALVWLGLLTFGLGAYYKNTNEINAVDLLLREYDNTITVKV